MEEIVEANYQRIKDEAADLVKRAWGETDTASKDGEGDSSEGMNEEEEEPGTAPIFVDPFHEF